jgi:hypothetical protein
MTSRWLEKWKRSLHNEITKSLTTETFGSTAGFSRINFRGTPTTLSISSALVVVAGSFDLRALRIGRRPTRMDLVRKPEDRLIVIENP